jgi:formamidopyrimidine-DNA glycosylase
MPELPEVETVCRGLRPLLEGKVIQSLVLHRSNLRYPFPVLMAERLVGQKIRAIERRAKYILLHTDQGYIWLIHLGMSGRLQQKAENQERTKHDHLVCQMDDGTCVVYHDPRRFGFMDVFAQNLRTENKHLKALGWEPFDPQLTGAVFYQLCQRRNRTLKALLLDQSFVVGLGNIYVCESLWLSRISPHRLASSLSLKECQRLLESIRLILMRAIEAGGSSLKDHRQVNGELGYFQHAFAVYDAAGRPCQTDQCQGTIQREVQNNRATFYCPQCQY